MNVWKLLHPKMTEAHLGYLPRLINETFPGKVAQQLAKNYAHGGGYIPFGRGQWEMDPKDHSLKYPGDPRLKPIASTKIRDEELYFYNHALLAIVQPDGDFVVVRVD